MRIDYDKDQLSYALANALKERDEAREALADWENAAAHVEADHPDEKHCGCVPVLRKLLHDARRERDEAREQIAKLRYIAEMAIEYVGHTAVQQKLRAEFNQLKELRNERV